MAISNYRIEDYARDVERFVQSGAVDDAQCQTDLGKGLEKLRDHARAFFSELAFAHRSSDRLRGEERVRATDASLFNTREAAAYVAGALDIIEATLVLSVRKRADRSDGGRPARTPPRSPGAPARSATTCGSCCEPAIRPTSTSWSSVEKAFFSAHRRSMSRRS